MKLIYIPNSSPSPKEKPSDANQHDYKELDRRKTLANGLCCFVSEYKGVDFPAYPAIGEYRLKFFDYWPNRNKQGDVMRVNHAVWIATLTPKEFFDIINSPNGETK